MLNYSFWADEAFISAVAARLIRDQISFFDAIQIPGVSYQKFHMLSVALSFKLFGISELAGRLPSILAFVIGAVLIFLLARKLSNIYGALISAYLCIFSHLNLAYATQAKPYAAIETLTLGVMLLILYLEKEKKRNRIIAFNLGIIFLCTVATFFHFIGFLLWIFYFAYIGSALRKIRFNKKGVMALMLPTVLLIILSVQFIVPTVIVLIKTRQILSFNHLYQVVRLFGYQYFFITLVALFGFKFSFSKHKVFSIYVLIWGASLFILASFQHYIFNIRYVLPSFGILFLYFGVFWGEIAKTYFKRKEWIVPLVVILVFYISGYKIVRRPQAYYSPNIDKYGDVQVANYKDFYSILKKRYPEFKTIAVFNDTIDAEEWYFGRSSTAYFRKFIAQPKKASVAHVMIYGSLEDFKKEMRKYPKGLVIMEDWESFFPEDIKQYVKHNLKLEYRVEGLKEAPDDPWPLALYSWGM